MKEKRTITRYIPLIVICTVLIFSVVSLVSAYYIRKTDEVTNKFTPADSVKPTVFENFDGAIKKNVQFNVGNTGYSVFVRVAVVVTWKNDDDIVYFDTPKAGEDYMIEYDLDNGWVQDTDGYYYYTSAVGTGKSTPVLVKTCTEVKDKAPEGYHLSVEFIVQTVQAAGYTDLNTEDPTSTEIPAYKDAWENSTVLP